MFFRNLENWSDLENADFEVKVKLGEISTPLLTDESSHVHPISSVCITKQIQEQLVMTVSVMTVNIDAVALRFQNVYGEGQSLKNPYTGILSIFSTQILNEKASIFLKTEQNLEILFI